MYDAVQSCTSVPIPATFCRGSTQIDGVFVSCGIVCTRGCFLPFKQSSGDHRAIVIDINLETFSGTPPLLIVKPPSR